MEKILYLPSNITEAQIEAYYNKNSINIGASSVPTENNSTVYSKCFKIPWITEVNFLPKIKELINKNSITKLIIFNESIFQEIKDYIDIEVINKSSPYKCEKNIFFIEKSKYFIEKMKDEKNKVQFSELQISSLFKNFYSIPGQCSDEKFLSLLTSAIDAPEGDFIEIGSFYGKSAFILGWCANFKKKTYFLAVDPWNKLKKTQIDAHETINHSNKLIDLDSFHNDYIINTWANIYKKSNYIMDYSENAFDKFILENKIESLEYGKTKYSGSISLLHIDGNHDYDYVKKDIELWGGLVMSGGWIVIDDYNWCYGSGPKNAADEFLFENANKIDLAFYSGGALFIKLI